MPSAGLPMASDLAMVSGLTGLIASTPALKETATGEQPVACAARELRDLHLHLQDERRGEVVLVLEVELLEARARQVAPEDPRLDELRVRARRNAIEDGAKTDADAAAVRLGEIDARRAVLFQRRAPFDDDPVGGAERGRRVARRAWHETNGGLPARG